MTSGVTRGSQCDSALVRSIVRSESAGQGAARRNWRRYALGEASIRPTKRARRVEAAEEPTRSATSLRESGSTRAIAGRRSRW